MADRWAVATGNWSATATWDGGTTLPGAGDDVYANGKTITIDQDITVLSLRTTAGTTAVAGGGFTLNDGKTINATGTGIVAGSTNCVTFSAASPAASTINGNCVGSTTTNTTGAAINSGTGTLTINGNCTAGNGTNRWGVQNSSTGTINITGNVTGGGGTNAAGASGGSTGTINITGNVTGGSSAAGYGVHNTGNGRITIIGDIIPATAAGANNALAGLIAVIGNFQSVSTGVAPYGPAGGRLAIGDSISITHAYREWDGASVGAERTLSTSSGGGGGLAGPVIGILSPVIRGAN